MTGKIYPVIMARRAKAELAETVRYVRRESPANAVKVAAAIARKLAQLRRFPRGAPIDADAPVPPQGAEPRVAHASGFLIHYVFPLRKDGREVLYVVCIRRAAEPPPDDAEYMLRFLQEIAGLYATPRTGSAP